MKVKNLILSSLFVVITISILIYAFRWGGVVASIFETALIFAVANPSKTSGYVGSAYKQLRTVNFWFEKNAVKKRVESIINLSAKQVNDEGVLLLKHTIDIKWAEPPQSREAFLKNGKMVVCLEPSTSEARNIARATILYTNESILPESRRLVYPIIVKAAVYAVTRKMLMLDRKLDALNCFNEEYYKPEVANNAEIDTYVQTMEKLDRQGLFTRLLMQEFAELDIKYPTIVSDPEAEQETKSFFEMLKRLMDKERGEDVDLSHRGQFIDTNIMLVAREGVYLPFPYVSYAEGCWKRGLTKLCVIAMDDKVKTAMQAVMTLKAMGLFNSENEYSFQTKTSRRLVNSYIAILSRKELPVSKKIDPEPKIGVV